jgi:hypothetical protein
MVHRLRRLTQITGRVICAGHGLTGERMDRKVEKVKEGSNEELIMKNEG